MRKILVLLFTVFLSLTGYSQVKSTNYSVGMNYLNNYVFNGRSDSLNMTYFIPSFTYENENGLTLNSDIYFISNSANKGFDFLELNAEYEFDIYKKLSGGVNATKFFSNGKSDSFIGNLSFTVGGYLSQDLGIFELSSDFDLLKGSGYSDIRISPGIEKTFSWEKGDHYFEIVPSFYAVFSTLNYFEGYTNIRKVNRLKSGPILPINTTINTVVTNPGFTFLAYEISLPLTYETSTFGISVQPTFAMPKNPIITNEITTTTAGGRVINTTTVNDTPYSERNLTNLFYGQINLYLKF